MTTGEARYVWENRHKGWWDDATVALARRILDHDEWQRGA